MEENKTTENQNKDEELFREFRRLKRREEAEANVAKLEYDILSADTDKTTLHELCKRANSLKLGGIVVLPYMVRTCVAYLGEDPQSSLIAAVSYPSGGELTETKVEAVKRAVRDGVDETEVWAPVYFIKDGNFVYLKRECKKLVKASKNFALRMALDCSALREQEIIKACAVMTDCGVSCIRLCGCGSELLSVVRSAIKGKCLLKCGGAESFQTFANLTVMGASCVQSDNALILAEQLLKQAEE